MLAKKIPTFTLSDCRDLLLALLQGLEPWTL